MTKGGKKAKGSSKGRGRAAAVETSAPAESTTTVEPAATVEPTAVVEPTVIVEPKTAADGETPKTRGRRLARLAREVLTGLLFAALLLGAKLLVEQSSFGAELESMSYNLLQMRLGTDRVPVKVLDVGGLRPAPFDADGRKGIATPRAPLRELIAALVDKRETRPKAVGIDIDFSPDSGEYVHPADEEFFKFCASTAERTGVPIFLGVGRADTGAPEDWLGTEEFAGLAADLSVPGDRRKILRWVRAGEGRPLPSISAALADAHARKTAEDSPGLLRRAHAAVLRRLEESHLIERVGERVITPGLEIGEFLVDFSSLDALRETSMRTINPVVVRDQSAQFAGKVVLVGDATLGEAEDAFAVPARREYIPGVYVHAAAVKTLVDAPLYEVTHKGRVRIDLLLTGFVVLCAALVNYYFAGRTARGVSSRSPQGLLILLVAASALAAGVVFVRVTRVMWDDFILALGVLAMHPSAERGLRSLWKGLRGAAPRAVKSAARESDEEARG